MTDEVKEAGKEEPEEETEEGAEEEAPEAEGSKESPKAPQTGSEMKVVIILKGENVMLGIQSPDCDPVYTTMKGDLAAALQVVPTLVAEAKLKWIANPRYPKANLPEPPPSPTPARTPAAPRPEKPKAQPSFF